MNSFNESLNIVLNKYCQFSCTTNIMLNSTEHLLTDFFRRNGIKFSKMTGHKIEKYIEILHLNFNNEKIQELGIKQLESDIKELNKHWIITKHGTPVINEFGNLIVNKDGELHEYSDPEIIRLTEMFTSIQKRIMVANSVLQKYNLLKKEKTDWSLVRFQTEYWLTVILTLVLTITITLAITSLIHPFNLQFPFSETISIGIIAGIFTVYTTLNFLCNNQKGKNSAKFLEYGNMLLFSTVLYTLFLILAAFIELIGTGDVTAILGSLILAIPSLLAITVSIFYFVKVLIGLTVALSNEFVKQPIDNFIKKIKKI